MDELSSEAIRSILTSLFLPQMIEDLAREREVVVSCFQMFRAIRLSMIPNPTNLTVCADIGRYLSVRWVTFRLVC